MDPKRYSKHSGIEKYYPDKQTFASANTSLRMQGITNIRGDSGKKQTSSLSMGRNVKNVKINFNNTDRFSIGTVPSIENMKHLYDRDNLAQLVVVRWIT